MLTYSERLEVERAFAAAIFLDPLTAVEAVFLGHGKAILRDLPRPATPREIASFTLSACLLSRWTCSPPLLEMLLEYLVTEKLKSGFSAILERVRAGTDPNSGAYASSWLLNDSRPFFDRHDLRSFAQLLVEQNGRPVLRLTADGRGYGKSYSLRFLEHVEDNRPADVRVLAALVSDGTAPSYQVEDLLVRVGSQLGNVGPLPERTRSSYSEGAASWLLQHLMSTRDLWVVVLDGFGQQGISGEVHDTIQSLAQQVTMGQYRRRIRLVLLDYRRKLKRVDAADILTETLRPPASICRADLMPCLESWDGLRKKNGLVGMAAGELEALADGILARAPAVGNKRLEKLNSELVKLLSIPGAGV